MKLSEARRDVYRRMAKNKGYRSRSAYKLLQINYSYHLLRPGNRVVDLGSAPGGWLQVAKKCVGIEGVIIGVDTRQIEPIEGVTILQASIEDRDVMNAILSLLGHKADVVLSDLSPNLSGIWDLDHGRQISLTRSALEVAHDILREDGTSVFKVFEGDLYDALKKEIRTRFNQIYVNKPRASRQRSSEQYLVCFGFKA
jgi:23S rRNA (uridine2552-2'-O)-methyltransferase